MAGGRHRVQIRESPRYRQIRRKRGGQRLQVQQCVADPVHLQYVAIEKRGGQASADPGVGQSKLLHPVAPGQAEEQAAQMAARRFTAADDFTPPAWAAIRAIGEKNLRARPGGEQGGVESRGGPGRPALGFAHYVIYARHGGKRRAGGGCGGRRRSGRVRGQGLHVVELAVGGAGGIEPLIRAVGDDAALVEHEDPRGVAEGAEAVRDHG